MLWLLFQIFTNISSKVDMEFILWCFILMDCSCFFLIAWKSMNDCNWMIIFPLLEFSVWRFVLYLSILTPFPNGYMCCFNHLHNLNYWFQYLALLKFISERSLSGKKSQILSKVVFAVTLRLPLQPWVYFEW